LGDIARNFGRFLQRLPPFCLAHVPERLTLPPSARLIRSRARFVSGWRRAARLNLTAAGPTGRRGNIEVVPTISRFFGISIAMYFDDHGYPHFHARHTGTEAKVRIDQIEVIESTLAIRQLRLVLAWAELHQLELLENWRRARAGETLLEIEPLR
jgi:hypothetical protein